MILEYGFKNFFSFRENTIISFEFDSNVPVAVSGGREAANILGVKGGNASGKTSIIRALRFIKYFVVESSESSPEKKIPLDCFYFDKDKPTELYAEFKVGDCYYKYEVSLTKSAVISESISKKLKKWVPVVIREQNKIVYLKKELSQFQNIILNGNASLISTYSKFGFFKDSEDLEAIYWFFDSMIVNVRRSGLVDGLDFKEVSEYYHENKKPFAFAKDIIKKSDTGITDIKIFSDVDQAGDKYFYPKFYHSVDGKEFPLSYSRESSGTKQLYLLMGMYWYALDAGSVLALDEFDIHLHALLLPEILDLFEDEKTNKKGAQFVFTSHNTEVIDSLGKYRTILVNKEDNESYCYRLDEIPGNVIRNDRPISPIYISGKLGGVPKL